MSETGEGTNIEPRVLVVDNEEEVRNSLQEIVEEAGYACIAASSGDKALEVLDETPVDVVITDVKMPGMSGFALTEKIKKRHQADVIIITGYGREFSYDEAVAKGASDFAVKPVRPRELIARVKRVLRERALIAEREEMESRLRQLTVTDDLTGLYNSRRFFETLRSEMERAARYGHPLSLLLLDVDDFKHCNDTYGHLEGDKVLAGLGTVIKSCMRKNDSGYRYGGDEFMVVLPETRGQKATRLAERIRREFCSAALSTVHKEGHHISVSIGVAEFEPGEKMDDFAKRADKAMYQAKAKGGNQAFLI